MSRGPPLAVLGLYENALKDVQKNAPRAAKMFIWLHSCRRPMGLLELGEVYAFYLEQDFEPERRLNEARDLLRFCAPFLKMAESTESRPSASSRGEIVEFSHYSMYEFVGSTYLRERVGAPTHAFIAKMCLVYLLHFRIPSSGHSGSIKDITLQDYPLLEYAAENWSAHYREAGDHDYEQLNSLVKSLLSEKRAYDNWLRWSGLSDHDLSPPPIYYMSLLGLVPAVQTILKQGVHPDDGSPGLHGTALGAACAAKYEDTARLLHEHGASISTASPKEGVTPLHLAAKGLGPGLILRLLKGATRGDVILDVDLRDNHGSTPLHYAVDTGNEETASILVQYKADIHATNAEKLTPLDIALSKDKGNVVKMLVGFGFDVDAFYGEHGTRLQHAVRSGNQTAVKILLDVGANPNLFREPEPFPHYEPGTPLQEAIAFGEKMPCGHEGIVKLLLDCGADPNIAATGHGTALHWAAGAGNEQIFKLLLDAGAVVHAIRDNDEYALNVATKGGHTEIVRLLLDAGADPQKGDSGPMETPLDCAIRKKFTTIEQILRDHGA